MSNTGAFHYALDVASGIAKAAIDRLITEIALELRPHNIQSLTFHKVGESQTKILAFPEGESVVFIDKPVAALAKKATDAELIK